MPRINAVSPFAVPARSQSMLDAVARKLGRVPNLMQTLAHSPAALKCYLSQTEALSGGQLQVQLREQIALVAAGINQCDYCAAAHTQAGQRSGLDAAELADNLAGKSHDPKTQAALIFVRQILTKNGFVGADALQAVRNAGYGEGELVEMIAHVGMNIFTNYFNHIAGTEIDFPRIKTT